MFINGFRFNVELLKFAEKIIMHFSKLFKFCPVCGSSQFVENNVKSKRCLDCGFVWYVNASAAVAAIIVNEKNEVLVAERGIEPAKGMWDMPGGFIDDGESAEFAVRREVKEELGLDLDNGQFLFSIQNQYTFSGWTLPTLDIFFLFEVENVNPIPADDVADCYFVPLAELDEDKFGFVSMKKAVRQLKTMLADK